VTAMTKRKLIQVKKPVYGRMLVEMPVGRWDAVKELLPNLPAGALNQIPLHAVQRLLDELQDSHLVEAEEHDEV